MAPSLPFLNATLYTYLPAYLPARVLGKVLSL